MLWILFGSVMFSRSSVRAWTAAPRWCRRQRRRWWWWSTVVSLMTPTVTLLQRRSMMRHFRSEYKCIMEMNAIVSYGYVLCSFMWHFNFMFDYVIIPVSRLFYVWWPRSFLRPRSWSHMVSPVKCFALRLFHCKFEQDFDRWFLVQISYFYSVILGWLAFGTPWANFKGLVWFYSF